MGPDAAALAQWARAMQDDRDRLAHAVLKLTAVVERQAGEIAEEREEREFLGTQVRALAEAYKAGLARMHPDYAPRAHATGTEVRQEQDAAPDDDVDEEEDDGAGEEEDVDGAGDEVGREGTARGGRWEEGKDRAGGAGGGRAQDRGHGHGHSRRIDDEGSTTSLREELRRLADTNAGLQGEVARLREAPHAHVHALEAERAQWEAERRTLQHRIEMLARGTRDLAQAAASPVILPDVPSPREPTHAAPAPSPREPTHAAPAPSPREPIRAAPAPSGGARDPRVHAHAAHPATGRSRSPAPSLPLQHPPFHDTLHGYAHDRLDVLEAKLHHLHPYED